MEEFAAEEGASCGCDFAYVIIEIARVESPLSTKEGEGGSAYAGL